MELNNWVSDKLHDILGFSDKHTVEYLLSLSKSTKSSDIFREKLQGFLGSGDGNILSFANDLWQRVPHQEVGENPNRARERELVAQQKHNMSYRMLSDDDDDDDEVTNAMAAKNAERKNAKRRKHLRKKAEVSESSEEEVTEEKNDELESGDEWEESEKDRMKDLEERDAFSARLKEKDKEKQRSVVEQSDKKVSSKELFVYQQLFW